MHAAPHRRAHRRLLSPPKGLPMRSLRSRPSRRAPVTRFAAPDSGWAKRLACGAGRSDNASVSTTTPIRRMHNCTGRTRAAARCYMLEPSPPSPIGASELICMPTRYAKARVEPRQSDCLPRPHAGSGPEPAQPYRRLVNRCSRRTLRTAPSYSSNVPSSSASSSAVSLPSPNACDDRTHALPLRLPYPLLFDTSPSAPAKTRAAMVAL